MTEKKISDNKFVKTSTDTTTLTGIVAGIEWLLKKVIKEPRNFDPSSNLMNYVEFTMDVVATSSCSKTTSCLFFFFFSYIKMGSVITKIVRETIQELIEITKNLWLKRKLMNGYPESTVSRLINN